MIILKFLCLVIFAIFDRLFCNRLTLHVQCLASILTGSSSIGKLLQTWSRFFTIVKLHTLLKDGLCSFGESPAYNKIGQKYLVAVQCRQNYLVSCGLQTRSETTTSFISTALNGEINRFELFTFRKTLKRGNDDFL